MAWFQDLARNLGTQNAPFGFAPVGSPSQGPVDPAYNAGMDMIGNIGMGMLASGSRNPLQAFGRSYLGAQEQAQQQNKNQYIAAEMMSAAEEKKQERARKDQLTTKWQDFVQKNSTKFGDYADIAPYLDPGEGMQILSGMTPDWRPASPEEKAAYGVDPTSPLVFGKGGEPKILGGGGTTINNNMSPGDTQWEKEAAGVIAKRYGDIIADGDKANSMKGDINALKDIGTMVTTGKGAEVINALGPYADALGIKLDGLGAGQAYEAVVSRLAPSLRTPGVGGSSDFDAKQFLRSLPALGNTPDGNQIISDTLEAVANYKIQAAEIASAALRGEITRAQSEKALRALPDPWTAWKSVSGKYTGTASGGSAVQDGKSDNSGIPVWNPEKQRFE